MSGGVGFLGVQHKHSGDVFTDYDDYDSQSRMNHGSSSARSNNSDPFALDAEDLAPVDDYNNDNNYQEPQPAIKAHSTTSHYPAAHKPLKQSPASSSNSNDSAAVTKLKQQNRALLAKLEEYKQLLHSQQAQHERELSAQMGPSPADAEELAEAYKRIEGYRKINDQLKKQATAALNPEKISLLNNRIRDVESQLVSMATENRTLKSEVRRYVREIENVSERHDDYPSVIAKLADELRFYKEKVRKFQAKTNNQEQDVRKMQLKYIELEKKYKKLLADSGRNVYDNNMYKPQSFNSWNNNSAHEVEQEEFPVMRDESAAQEAQKISEVRKLHQLRNQQQQQQQQQQQPSKLPRSLASSSSLPVLNPIGSVTTNNNHNAASTKKKAGSNVPMKASGMQQPKSYSAMKSAPPPTINQIKSPSTFSNNNTKIPKSQKNKPSIDSTESKEENSSQHSSHSRKSTANAANSDKQSPTLAATEVTTVDQSHSHSFPHSQQQQTSAEAEDYSLDNFQEEAKEAQHHQQQQQQQQEEEVHFSKAASTAASRIASPKESRVASKAASPLSSPKHSHGSSTASQPLNNHSRPHSNNGNAAAANTENNEFGEENDLHNDNNLNTNGDNETAEAGEESYADEGFDS
jgi:hypothetical protein